VAAGNPVPADRIQKLNLRYIFDGERIQTRAIRPNSPPNRPRRQTYSRWSAAEQGRTN
jgi:hypothetical protein